MTNTIEDFRRRHREFYAAFARESRRHVLLEWEWEMYPSPDVNRWEQALLADVANLRSALTASAQDGDWESAAALAQALAFVWRKTEVFEEASRWLDRCLDAIGERAPELRAELLASRGEVAFRSGDYAGAHLAFTESLGLYRRSGDARRQAETLARMAWNHLVMRDSAQAIAHAERAMTVAEGLKDDRARAHGLYTLAWAHTNEDVRESLRFAEECLRLVDATDDGLFELLFLSGLANIFRHRAGDPRRAAELRERSVDIVRSLHPGAAGQGWLQSAEGQASSIAELAVSRAAGGRPAEALTLFEEALSVARAGASWSVVAHVLRSMGTTAMRLGDFGRARTLVEEAVLLLAEQPPASYEARFTEANIYSSLAWVHMAVGGFEDALRAVDRSVALVRRLGYPGRRPEVLWLRADIHAWRGNVQAAIADLEECVEAMSDVPDAGRPEGREFALLMTRALLEGARGDVAAAYEDGRRAIEAVRGVGDNVALAPMLYRFGRIARAYGAVEEAVAMLSEATDRGRELGFDWVNIIAVETAHAEIDAGRPEQAAERCREFFDSRDRAYWEVRLGLAEVAARLAAIGGDHILAARLLAAVDAVHAAAGTVVPASERGWRNELAPRLGKVEDPPTLDEALDEAAPLFV
jgi:tetratricopeptide (TPR) repeat protein